MKGKEFAKEAGEYATRECCATCKNTNHFCNQHCECWIFAKKGAEFGYKKGFEECAKARLNVTTISDCPIKDEWHYVKNGDLPSEDLRQKTLGYYLTASKHKSYKGYVFEVAYFTGVIFTKGGDMLDNVIAWKEIVLPELPKER